MEVLVLRRGDLQEAGVIVHGCSRRSLVLIVRICDVSVGVKQCRQGPLEVTFGQQYQCSASINYPGSPRQDGLIIVCDFLINTDIIIRRRSCGYGPIDAAIVRVKTPRAKLRDLHELEGTSELVLVDTAERELAVGV